MSTAAPAWHQRIGVRVAVLVAFTILIYDALSVPLHERFFSLVEEPGFSDFIRDEDLERLANNLLLDAARRPSGEWIPSEAARDRLSYVLGSDELGFVWIGTDGRILASSDDYALPHGMRWPFGYEASLEMFSPADPNVQAVARTHPIEREGQSAGTFVLMHWEDVEEAEVSEELEEYFEPAELELFAVYDQILRHARDEYRAARKRAQSRSEYLSIGVAVLIALLFGVLISRLVTRRLTRLSAVASTVPSDSDGIPGPFVERGQDEIARLAQAMNAMRERVTELVHGMEQEDRRRREWIAQVSHDLRTPLTALVACLERAHGKLEDLPARAGEELREWIDTARLDVDRLQALTTDLLDIARLDAREQLHLEPVPPGELVRQVVRSMHPAADKLGLELEAEPQSGLPDLQADGHRLMRALENLVRNSLQHTESRVSVSAARLDGGVWFQITDDGRGFPAPKGRVELGQLRDRREQADSAGLGLLVAEKVAQAHGGYLEARNLAPRGAAVGIFVPTAAHSETASEGPSSQT